MNIMLVDDEKDILRYVEKFLKDFGHHITLAHDGLEALTRISDIPKIELVISDICMPKLDGLEFLRLARIQRPGIPILLITGYGDEKLAVQAFQFGAFDYLKKPISLKDLMACINRIEKRNRLETEILSGRLPNHV